MLVDLPPLTAITLGELQSQLAADFSIPQVFTSTRSSSVIVESVPDPEPFIETVVVPGIGRSLANDVNRSWWNVVVVWKKAR